MPQSGVALEKLGFLTIGLFDGDNPGPGHQTTLEMIALGERLGFDSAWVRQRIPCIRTRRAPKTSATSGWRDCCGSSPGNRRLRAVHPLGDAARVSQGLVIPTDSLGRDRSG